MQAQLNVLNGQVTPLKMKTIQNDFTSIKPKGGLWTSNYVPEIGSEWVQYSFKVGGPRVPDSDVWEGSLLYPNRTSRLYVIDRYQDLERLMHWFGVKNKLKNPSFYSPRLDYSIDFEKMSQYYDGIHLTKRGQIRTQTSYPFNLDGWDVESTLWFRWVFDHVEEIHEVFYRKTSFVYYRMSLLPTS
ncbi:hypothetical protein [Tepidibacillus sp. HK-1]|uniref:hypothetical protein n=1 Tax=Tepidibacillus sp. HK-1 TaxID=1883407 RepID=UPI000853E910|nr:hypothetical protein [Tepidibacillus sp. HK-1]GBF10918.1 hypothetical protein HK1_00934 [Tepidibacillus sp. HK-1]